MLRDVKVWQETTTVSMKVKVLTLTGPWALRRALDDCIRFTSYEFDMHNRDDYKPYSIYNVHGKIAQNFNYSLLPSSEPLIYDASR